MRAIASRSRAPLFLFVSFPSHLLFSPFYSPSLPIVVFPIRGHIHSSPPPPLRFVPCIVIAKKNQLFRSSSTRGRISPTSGYFYSSVNSTS